MKLHQNIELFQDAVLSASQRFSIPEIYVEKDYWVTLVLCEIFHSEIADQVVFKGGTSLSKCHKLIQRFSEDIDLVVLRNEGENDNQLKRKIRTISKIVENVVPEIQVEGLTNKKGNIRKTVHQYERFFKGSFGQVREPLVLEATWLGNFEPFTYEKVSCYAYEVMKQTKQVSMIEEYGLHPFEVQVLSIERTFCEKIMSLVRFSHTDDPYTNLSNKIRHVYDIHLMMNDGSIQSFFKSSEFDKMLVNVGKDDFISYKNDNAWLKDHPSTALIFKESDKTWSRIQATYRTIFKELVIGKLPNENDLVDTLQKIAERLRLVHWEI